MTLFLLYNKFEWNDSIGSASFRFNPDMHTNLSMESDKNNR